MEETKHNLKFKKGFGKLKVDFKPTQKLKTEEENTEKLKVDLTFVLATELVNQKNDASIQGLEN